jgi:hypothetical protein
MNKLYGLAAFTLALTTAFFAGVSSGANSARDREASAAIKAIEPGPVKERVVQQEVTKVVTKTEYVMPEECLLAIQAAVENYKAVTDLLDDTGQLEKITSTLASAIVHRKVTELNNMRGQLRSYEGAILGSVLDLGNAQESLEYNNQECSEVMGEQALGAP